MQTSNNGNQQMGNIPQNNCNVNISKEMLARQPQNNRQANQSNMQANQSNMWQGNMAPGSVIGSRQNVKVIDSYDFSKYGIRVEILEYQELLGNTNVYGAQSLWFMKETNIKCRQVAIYILDSGVKIEAGAMSYFQGPLQMNTGINSGSKLLRQAFTSKLTGEKLAMPEYFGSGILVLEPSFKHFIIVELEQGESLICDKGMFYAASQTVNIQPCFAGNTSGTVLGGEGIFQQLITGPGMLIMESPVPMCEINKVVLNNDILRVDGNFALLRTGNIQMSVEPVSPSLVGSAVSGEGLVNVFRGTGEVWLAPTIKVYDAIKLAKALGGELNDIDFNTSTGQTRIK